MLHAGEVLMNRYEVIGVIGKGGMSTVYQARDLKNHQLLAIKDVKRAGKENNQVVEQSLAAEGRMLMQLSNPHLPKIHDIIEENERIMLVMDFIHGESMDKMLARNGAQNVELVLNWGMQICEVFHYLHNQPTPIIYRDMKPANIMIQPDGRLMLIDFGTARTQKIGVSMQADTICIGTEGFAAPEQFGGLGQSTAQTDIFCLGATLYNMVTGHSPCDRPTGILPLEQWNPELKNSPISEIIIKCTRRDPNERYGNAMELYDDLYMASIGTYKTAGKKGFSPFTGALTGWQKQDVHNTGMVTSGLSDILHGLNAQAKTSASGQLKRRGEDRTEHLTANLEEWKSARSQTVVQQTAAPVEQPQSRECLELRGQLIQIALLIAVIFVILAIVLLLLRKYSAAGVFVLIALVAAVTSAIGVMLSHKSHTDK